MFSEAVLTYAFGELALALLLICGYLFWHVRGLKGLVTELEDKITSLRETLKETKEKAKDMVAKAKEGGGGGSGRGYLENQLAICNEKYAETGSSLSMEDALLEGEEGSVEQAAAMRAALLESEIDALDDNDVPVWDKLQDGIGSLFARIRGAQGGAGGDDEEKENLKKRVANLEKFQKLFFDMESQWRNAQKKAEEYEEQLKAAMGDNLSGDVADALERYKNIYSDFGQDLAKAMNTDSSSYGGGSGSTVIVNNEEELRKLRVMAYNQHQVIEDLQAKLNGAATAAEKTKIINELNEELERQKRFLAESETCVQLVEDELTAALKDLDTANAELEKLKQQGGGSDEAGPERDEVEKIVLKFTRQSKDLLNTISTLEAENEALRKNAINSSKPQNAGVPDMETEQKLKDTQQELLNLQTKYLELEERYIELRTQNM